MAAEKGPRVTLDFSLDNWLEIENLRWLIESEENSNNNNARASVVADLDDKIQDLVQVLNTLGNEVHDR